MKRVQADFDLEGGWETWIFEVPDDWEPEDGITGDDVRLMAKTDEGNTYMHIVEDSIEELDSDE